MKILFCSPVELRRELGSSKIMIELAAALVRCGVVCELVGPKEVGGGSRREYAEALSVYLERRASFFDVVEFEHWSLPFLRERFSAETLLVARVSLLSLHFLSISIPRFGGFKHYLRVCLSAKALKRERAECAAMAIETMRNADLVNVANHDDRSRVTEAGIDAKKVIVEPYGVDSSRRDGFNRSSHQKDLTPRIVWVGSFDPRKGAVELPQIVREVRLRFPEVRFQLLGTAGAFTDSASVVKQFYRHDQPYVEVIPRFEAEKLPKYLAGAWLGLFPSYVESFGFGVVEMMAAGIPVAAYRCPGPAMMLPSEWMVPVGDWKALSNRILLWLSDSRELDSDRLIARERSESFDWDLIARSTLSRYEAAKQRRVL